MRIKFMTYGLLAPDYAGLPETKSRTLFFPSLVAELHMSCLGSKVRGEFPAIARNPDDHVLCDGPTGTQAHSSAIAAISDYLSSVNANLGGRSPGALRAIDTARRAREMAAAFMNCKEQEVSAPAKLLRVPIHLTLDNAQCV